MEIELIVLSIGTGVYQVETVLPDNIVDIEVFERSNAVFPAYIKLRKALSAYQNVTIHVTTNSYSLAVEYNAVKPNPNARLLSELNEVIARNSLTVTVEYMQ